MMNKANHTHSNRQYNAYLSVEANYISWVRNVINIFNGATAMFISAILLSLSSYEERIRHILATAFIVVGFVGILISFIWQIGCTLEFRPRRRTLLQEEKLYLTTEKSYIWKYLNALLLFLVLGFLVIFVPIISFI
jgi:hypothetical protein